MIPELADTFFWGALAAFLTAVIFYDLREMRIPNGLSLAVLALFAASLPLIGVPADMLARIGLAASVFCAGFVGFVFRILGGGDVKIMSALALFVPLGVLPEVLLVFSITLIASTFAVILSRQVAASPESAWAVLRLKKMPMGLAIGLAGLIALGMSAGTA